MSRDLCSHLKVTQTLAPAVYDADKNAVAVDLKGFSACLLLVTAGTTLSKTVKIELEVEDALLATFIAAARQHGEQLTGRQFVEAEFELLLKAFLQRDGPIVLPRPPLQSVETIAYVGLNVEEQTLAASNYHVGTAGQFGALYPAEVSPWSAGHR